MDDAADRAARSARELARRLGIDHHDVLVVLGSGLSGDGRGPRGRRGRRVPLDTLPFFPPYTAGGHRAQGWSVAPQRPPGPGPRRALPPLRGPRRRPRWSIPLRTGIAAGCRTVILTAAAGGIRDDLDTGSVMVVEDHLNLTGRSPLIGPDFVDMADAYAPRAARARSGDARAGRRRAVAARPGVYAQLPGPQFETPAEIRMLRTPGADVVGHVDGARDHRRPPGRRRGPGAGPGHQPGRRGRTPPIDVADIADVGAAAVPAVAAIVRHVVGSLP